MPSSSSSSSPPTPSPLPRRHRQGRVWALRVAAVAAALAVFALYTRPQFMVMLADQVWSCF